MTTDLHCAHSDLIVLSEWPALRERTNELLICQNLFAFSQSWFHLLFIIAACIPSLYKALAYVACPYVCEIIGGSKGGPGGAMPPSPGGQAPRMH